MAKINKNNKPGMIPYIFIAFFATFILADIAFFIIAKKTWRGKYTENSYQKGKGYNEVLQQIKAQKDLGWKFKPQLKQKGENLADLKLCLLDKNNKKIKYAKVAVKLRWPVQEGFDFQQRLIEQNDCYFGKFHFPRKGQWQFEFIAQKDGENFQGVKRYIIR